MNSLNKVLKSKEKLKYELKKKISKLNVKNRNFCRVATIPITSR